MKLVFSAFTVAVWLLLAIPVIAKQSSDVICTNDAKLDQYEGHWIHPKIISALKRGKSWSDAISLIGGYVETAIIIENRSISTTLQWHEGSGNEHCIVANKNGIRLKDEHDDHLKVDYVLPNHNARDRAIDVSIHQLIFGNKCFSTIQNEKWCITPVTVTINGKASSYQLQFDRSEMPDYGTPISLRLPKIFPSQEAFEFLIFEPRNYGWDVYRDSFVTRENYKRLDPLNKPWRKLIRTK